jgi:hypothetical protein
MAREKEKKKGHKKNRAAELDEARFRCAFLDWSQ